MGVPHAGKKKATNLSLDQELLKDAKALGVNISQAAETGLIEAVRKAKADTWLEENRGNLMAWGDWVEENGLPLENYRLFDV